MSRDLNEEEYSLGLPLKLKIELPLVIWAPAGGKREREIILDGVIDNQEESKTCCISVA